MTQANGQVKSSELATEAQGEVPSVAQPKETRTRAAARRARRPRVTAATIRQAVEELEVPFAPSLIEWRVTSRTKDREGNWRGLLMPYADQRAYTDRLNALFTPAGWTRRYTVHTSGTFERAHDGKMVSKVFVTCELNIFGLGAHSATGEEWTDNENAGTAAEAQAFKRACSCFGLGRYLYYFGGHWTDLDERKRPLAHPVVAGWATPEGWRQGLRPEQQGEQESQSSSREDRDAHVANAPDRGERAELVREIEGMAVPLGRALYRGILKSVANAWSPEQIRDDRLLEKVAVEMEAARKGCERLQVGIERAGSQALSEVLSSLRLKSINEVNSLEKLLSVIEAIEAKAENACDE